MKISGIIKRAVKKGQIYCCTDDDETTWIGDGRAMYAVPQLPDMTATEFFNTFDIDEGKRDTISFISGKLPDNLKNEPQKKEESILKKTGIKIGVRDITLMPFETDNGKIVFADTEDIKPLDGIFTFFYGSGKIFAYRGMLLEAVIDECLIPIDDISTIKAMAERI